MAQSESRSEIVVELAEQFLERYRRGERPSLKEYVDQRPDLAEEIREVFPAMAMMENIALADESIDGRQETEARGTTAAPLQQLGDYRIIREVGHGGMGVVYEAEQVSLGRHVALKLLPQKLLLSAKQKQRFEREAKAAAKLHHTNIVPVFGVGEQDGMPYYVMQFIQGLGLDEVLAELKRMRVLGAPTPSMPAEGDLRISRRDVSAANMARSLMTGDFTESQSGPEGKGEPGLAAQLNEAERHTAAVTQSSDIPDSLLRETTTGRLSDTSSLSASSVVLPGQSASARRTAKKQNYWQSVASIGVQVSDALDYAHKQGVLHRDIKPSNLLLDTRGTVWVTDFGLAKTDDQQNLTHTGDILGTLRYMSPEAFEGKSDQRSDVYSLGLTLYELLALRPAFDEKDRHRLIKKVTTEDPPRLNRLNSSISRDLVTIVHKAIDKDPARRYQSADELGADLQRFIDDEPIKARRLTLRERSWRWCRHNRLVAGLAASLLFLLLSSTIGSLLAAGYYDRLAKKEARTAQDERDARLEATANLQEAERQKTRAEANFAKARAAVDDYLTKISESQLIKVPGLQPLRRELLESALGFYQQFLKERGNDPAVQTELAAAHVRIARIYSELGKQDEARKNFDLAIAGYEATLQANRADNDVRFALANAFQAQGNLYFNSNHKESRLAYAKAVDLQEELLRIDPTSEDYKRELAKSYNGLAVMQADVNDGPAAFRSGQRCVELRQELVLNHPDSPILQHAMGESLANLGFMLSKRGHMAEALAMYERSLDYTRAAHESLPTVIEIGVDLHIAYRNIADANQNLLRPETSLLFAQRDVDHLTHFAEANPAVPEVQSSLLDALLYLCNRQAVNQDATGAWQTGRRIAGIISALPKQNAEDLVVRGSWRMRFRWHIGPCVAKLSTDEKKDLQHQPDEAIAEVRKAIILGFRDANRLRLSTVNALANPTLSSTDIAKEYEQILSDLDKNASAKNPAAEVQPIRQNVDASANQAEEAKIRPSTPPRSQIQADLALAHYAIALAQIEQDQLSHAEKSLDQAQPIFEVLDKNDTTHLRYRPFLASTYVVRGMLYWRAGQFEQGKKHWDKGLEFLETAQRSDPDNKLVQSLLADALWKIGASWGLTGCWLECAENWQRAFDHSPYDDWKAYELGSVLALTGDSTRYRAHCAKMLKHAKDSQQAQVTEQAARICCLFPPPPDQLASASVLADRAVQNGKGLTWEPYYVLAKGTAEYRKDNLDATVQLLESITVKFPTWGDSAWTLHIPRKAVLAMALFRLGRKDDARSVLASAIGQHSNLRSSFSVLPRDGWRIVDGLICRTLLREAQLLIQEKPMNETITISLRAHVYKSLGDNDKAAKELEKAPKLNENDDATLTALGSALARIGLTDSAQTYLDKALQINPNFLYALRERGELYVYQRKWRNAAANIATVVDKVKEQDYLFRLAPLLLQAGDGEGYERHCQSLCQQFKDTADPAMAERTAKACLFRTPPKAYREAALALADKAIMLDRRDWLTPFLRFSKGLAEYRRGNYGEAIKWCRQSLDAGESMIWFLRVQNELVIAMALAQKGEVGAAKTAIARAEQAMPSSFSEFDRAFAWGAWHDWLICQFLHAEAKETISRQSSEEKK